MSDELTVQPVTEKNWPDLEALFESKGAPGYCWCTVWRSMPNRARACSADRKAALHHRVRDGVPIGLLEYVGAEAIA